MYDLYMLFLSTPYLIKTVLKLHMCIGTHIHKSKKKPGTIKIKLLVVTSPWGREPSCFMLDPSILLELENNYVMFY